MSENNPLVIVNKLLEECYQLKDNFQPDTELQQESLEIRKIVSKIKLFISNRFGRDSVYYYCIGYSGTYNRTLFEIIIIGLENIREDLSNNFELINRIEFLLEESYKLKANLVEIKDSNQKSLKILDLLIKIKIIISNHFGRDSESYRIIDYSAGTYDQRILDNMIVGLESIKESLDNRYINVHPTAGEWDGLRHFEYKSKELIMAQFPGQEELFPYQQILEHGKQIPFDYSATGVQWDGRNKLFMSQSMYGLNINTIHIDGSTFVERDKINSDIYGPTISQFKSDFFRGKFSKPKYYDNWEVLSQLPKGGQGAVFKAKRRNEDDTKYALKSFIINNITSKKYKRYEREVEFLNFFKDSENVIRLIDEGGSVEHQGVTYYYYVMELADMTLSNLISKTNTISLENKFSIFNEILDAFQEVHEEGVVHRDAKPQNLLIKDNKIKIADFGIAYHKDFPRITDIRERVGPRDFICPEAEDGKINPDNRCDIYALGKIFYFILSKGITFSREKFDKDEYLLEKINKDDRFKIFLPFLKKASSTRREDRYSSVSEMKKEFDLLIQSFFPSNS